jgi:flavorubredoxin
VVGDIDVEIKLDEKGRFRAKAFSHSADKFSNYLDNSQRNGVGLVYQEEFSSFRDLFNSLIMSKKKRALKAAAREAKSIKE